MKVARAYRIIENQSRQYSYFATATDAQAEALETMIQETKPRGYSGALDPVLEAPFLYPLPVGAQFAARFKPPGSGRGVLFAGGEERVALYEHAYHFMREREHFKPIAETAMRTLIVFGIRSDRITDLLAFNTWSISSVMDRSSYVESHRFIEANHEIDVLQYPSCRHPGHGPCFAVFKHEAIMPRVIEESNLTLSYRPKVRSKPQTIRWIERQLTIAWTEVA